MSCQQRERTLADPEQDDAFYGSLVVDELGISNHHQFFGEGLGDSFRD